MYSPHVPNVRTRAIPIPLPAPSCICKWFSRMIEKPLIHCLGAVDPRTIRLISKLVSVRTSSEDIIPARPGPISPVIGVKTKNIAT